MDARPDMGASAIVPGIARPSEESNGTAVRLARRRPYEPPRILGEVTLESGAPVLQASVGGNMTGVQTTGQGVDDYNTNPGGGFNADWGE